MTLEEALRLPVLKSGRLLTDAGGDREITGVSVIEVPVGEFIRHGEFVLSTGIDVGRDAKLLTRFVQEIATGGASALAIAIGPHTPRIPKNVIAVAERLRFPLISLPWEVRFSEISEAILRKLIEETTHRRSRGDFVWALAHGTLGEEAAGVQASRFGFDAKRKLVGVTGKISRREGHPAQYDVHSQARVVESLCGRMAARNHLHWLGTVVGDAVIGYLQLPRTRRHLHTLLTSIRAEAEEDVVLSWGVGRICQAVADFQQSYEDARRACEIGMKLRGEKSVTDISDVLADRVLLQLKPDGDVALVFERYIEPLKKLQRTSPLPTLDAFFGCDSNASEAARKLAISRQSLLYRLSKIESALDIDLHNPEHRFALLFALRLYKLHNS